MGRKALLSVFCWLTVSEASAKMQTGFGVIDNISAESVSRLYRNFPVGVYAGSSPYAAYSFNYPTYVAQSSQLVPVKQESGVVLKDSYGQRFIGSPQTVAYKASFPQQFVELQNLPAHLRQPLVAAAPTLQYGQAPHFFGQSQFGVPHLQTLSPSNENQFSAQPLIYANNFRSLAPTEHKFERLQAPKLSSASSYNSLSPVQRAQANTLNLVQVPKQTSITTVTNGKKTVVNLITKPPVPLLDLTLLEPLTFENPLVPQHQHFLPRIHQATYKKLEDLPEINEVDEVKKHQMEFVVQKTKSYDSGVVKAKPQAHTKNQELPQSEEKHEEESPPSVTTVTTVHELSEETPEVSYEERSPNYQETVTEEKMSYNKETQSQPINISYNKKTESEPIVYSYQKVTEAKPLHYSFSHTSAPIKQAKQVINSGENPKHLIYQFTPEEQRKEHQEQPNASPPQTESVESSNDSSEESDEEEDQPNLGVPLQVLELVEEYNQKYPKKAAQSAPEHKEQTYYHYANEPEPQYQRQYKPQHQYEQQKYQQHHHQEQQKHQPHHREEQKHKQHHHDEQHHEPRNHHYHDEQHHEPRNHHHNKEQHHEPRNLHHNNEQHHEPRNHHHNNEQHHEPRNHHHNNEQNHEPRNHHHNNEQHHEPRKHHQSHHHQQKEHYQQQKHHQNQASSHSQKPHHAEEQFQPITPEYEEDIIILPTHKPHSEPKQNHQNYNIQIHHDSHPQQKTHQRHHDHHQTYPVDPHPHEKSNRIIIKEGTTAEEDRPSEELMKEMVKKQEESEEDFEKAYKDAAYGFQAYDTSAIDEEKEIYNPSSYGSARYHNNYDIEKSPLRQYEPPGDVFPSYARSQYKDARDKTTDGYYDEYDASRPESIRELKQHKDDYYETYKKNTPEKYKESSSEEQYYEKSEKAPKKEQAAKYRAAPSSSEEFSYNSEAPRDNKAHASRPLYRYKSKTQFVEPQYQYGFEPLSLPRLILDSELAAMASNVNPTSAKLGKKKIYAENFYYKKTSKAGKAGS